MEGNLKHLDTKNFNATIVAYANYMKKFDSIVEAVNNDVNIMLDNWKGVGRTAFKEDCLLVQRNLKEISLIMHDIRDALRDAHVEYIKSDLDISKKLES